MYCMFIKVSCIFRELAACCQRLDIYVLYVYQGILYFQRTCCMLPTTWYLCIICLSRYLVFSENLLHAANDLISMYCMFIKVSCIFRELAACCQRLDIYVLYVYQGILYFQRTCCMLPTTWYLCIVCLSRYLVFSENLLHAANDLISMYCMFIKVSCIFRELAACCQRLDIYVLYVYQGILYFQRTCCMLPTTWYLCIVCLSRYLVFSENLLHAANDLISMYCMFIKVSCIFRELAACCQRLDIYVLYVYQGILYFQRTCCMLPTTWYLCIVCLSRYLVFSENLLHAANDLISMYCMFIKVSCIFRELAACCQRLDIYVLYVYQGILYFQRTCCMLPTTWYLCIVCLSRYLVFSENLLHAANDLISMYCMFIKVSCIFRELAACCQRLDIYVLYVYQGILYFQRTCCMLPTTWYLCIVCLSRYLVFSENLLHAANDLISMYCMFIKVSCIFRELAACCQRLDIYVLYVYQGILYFQRTCCMLPTTWYLCIVCLSRYLVFSENLLHAANDLISMYCMFIKVSCIFRELAACCQRLDIYVLYVYQGILYFQRTCCMLPTTWYLCIVCLSRYLVFSENLLHAANDLISMHCMFIKVSCIFRELAACCQRLDIYALYVYQGILYFQRTCCMLPTTWYLCIVCLSRYLVFSENLLHAANDLISMHCMFIKVSCIFRELAACCQRLDIYVLYVYQGILYFQRTCCMLPTTWYLCIVCLSRYLVFSENLLHAANDLISMYCMFIKVSCIFRELAACCQRLDIYVLYVYQGILYFQRTCCMLPTTWYLCIVCLSRYLVFSENLLHAANDLISVHCMFIKVSCIFRELAACCQRLDIYALYVYQGILYFQRTCCMLPTTWYLCIVCLSRYLVFSENLLHAANDLISMHCMFIKVSCIFRELAACCQRLDIYALYVYQGILYFQRTCCMLPTTWYLCIVCLSRYLVFSENLLHAANDLISMYCMFIKVSCIFRELAACCQRLDIYVLYVYQGILYFQRTCCMLPTTWYLCIVCLSRYLVFSENLLHAANDLISLHCMFIKVSCIFRELAACCQRLDISALYVYQGILYFQRTCCMLPTTWYLCIVCLSRYLVFSENLLHAANDLISLHCMFIKVSCIFRELAACCQRLDIYALYVYQGILYFQRTCCMLPTTWYLCIVCLSRYLVFSENLLHAANDLISVYCMFIKVSCIFRELAACCQRLDICVLYVYQGILYFQRTCCMLPTTWYLCIVCLSRYLVFSENLLHAANDLISVYCMFIKVSCIFRELAACCQRLDICVLYVYQGILYFQRTCCMLPTTWYLCIVCLSRYLVFSENLLHAANDLISMHCMFIKVSCIFRELAACCQRLDIYALYVYQGILYFQRTCCMLPTTWYLCIVCLSRYLVFSENLLHAANDLISMHCMFIKVSCIFRELAACCQRLDIYALYVYQGILYFQRTCCMLPTTWYLCIVCLSRYLVFSENLLHAANDLISMHCMFIKVSCIFRELAACCQRLDIYALYVYQGILYFQRTCCMLPTTWYLCIVCLSRYLVFSENLLHAANDLISMHCMFIKVSCIFRELAACCQRLDIYVLYVYQGILYFQRTCCMLPTTWYLCIVCVSRYLVFSENLLHAANDLISMYCMCIKVSCIFRELAACCQRLDTYALYVYQGILYFQRTCCMLPTTWYLCIVCLSRYLVFSENLLHAANDLISMHCMFIKVSCIFRELAACCQRLDIYALYVYQGILYFQRTCCMLPTTWYLCIVCLSRYLVFSENLLHAANDLISMYCMFIKVSCIFRELAACCQRLDIYVLYVYQGILYFQRTCCMLPTTWYLCIVCLSRYLVFSENLLHAANDLISMYCMCIKVSCIFRELAACCQRLDIYALYVYQGILYFQRTCCMLPTTWYLCIVCLSRYLVFSENLLHAANDLISMYCMCIKVSCIFRELAACCQRLDIYVLYVYQGILYFQRTCCMLPTTWYLCRHKSSSTPPWPKTLSSPSGKSVTWCFTPSQPVRLYELMKTILHHLVFDLPCEGWLTCFDLRSEFSWKLGQIRD